MNPHPVGDIFLKDLSTTTPFNAPESAIEVIKNKWAQSYLMENFSTINPRVRRHIIILFGKFGGRDTIPFVIEQSLNPRNTLYCYKALFAYTNDDIYLLYEGASRTKENLDGVYKYSIEWWKENGPYLHRSFGSINFEINIQAKANKISVDEITGEPLEEKGEKR